MLVLTRKSEQKIRIGKQIVITILEIQGNQVSIGIEAPKETRILREELVKAIEQANAGGATDKNSHDVRSIAKTLNFKMDKAIPATSATESD